MRPGGLEPQEGKVEPSTLNKWTEVVNFSTDSMVVGKRGFFFVKPVSGIGISGSFT
jgi:hypothetical protein